MFLGSWVSVFDLHACTRVCVCQFEREKGVTEKKKVEREEDMNEEVVGRRLRKALRSVSTLQAEDGFWPSDYGGPLFLLPGLVGITLSFDANVSSLILIY